MTALATPPIATPVRERPIIFSGPMVVAILAGRKTLTRRVVTPQPLGHHYLQKMWGTSPPPKPVAFGTPYLWREVGPDYPDDKQDDRRCAQGEPGDLLYVKETIRWNATLQRAFFVADNAPAKIDAWPWQKPVLSSLYLPRGASRITLEITDVRAERLHDITDEDIVDEGIETDPDGVRGYYQDANGHGVTLPLREAFTHLWSQINGAASWSSNPWVWRIAFRRIIIDRADDPRWVEARAAMAKKHGAE